MMKSIPKSTKYGLAPPIPKCLVFIMYKKYIKSVTGVKYINIFHKRADFFL